MSWELFSYVCRKASVDCGSRESIQDCFSRIENEKPSSLYGNEIISNGLPRKLLDEVSNIRDRDKAIAIIDIYKKLKVTPLTGFSQKVNEEISYLSAILVVFFCILAIFQIKTMPALFSTMEMFELTIPPVSLFLQKYGIYLVLILGIFFLIAILIIHQMKVIIKFVHGFENNFLIKFGFYKGLIQRYKNVVDILHFPIQLHGSVEIQKDNSVFSHLKNISDSGMDLQEELAELLNIQMQELQLYCEAQLLYINKLLTSIIYMAVGFFLVATYIVIFELGGLV